MSTGLRFFKICHSAELNQNVEATMPMNLDDDRSLPAMATKQGLFGHRTDILNSPEGKCNRGIMDKKYL